jgi:DinB superfamily
MEKGINALGLMTNHPQQIKDWCAEIDTITSAVMDSFGLLNEEILNRKGTNGSWSIAENLKHLIIVNSTYFPVLDPLLEKADQTKISRLKMWFAQKTGVWILKRVARSRTNKMKTFPIWEPEQMHDDGNIIELFKQHQETLKKYVQRCLPLLEAGCLISSPASKVVIYSLEDAFRIIIEHEWRHILQARETSTLP